MRVGVLSSLVVVLSLGVAGSAAAQSWQPAQTLGVFRGAPEPDVAISDGRAAIVYSVAHGYRQAHNQMVIRRPGEAFTHASMQPAGTGDVRVAMNPAGSTATVAVAHGGLFVTLYPNVSPWGSTGRTVEIEAAGGPAEDPQIAVDDAGRVTVVWRARVGPGYWNPPNQVRAVTVRPDETVGEVQVLGSGSACNPALDVNVRGDAVVSPNCVDREAEVLFRPAGGSFGAAEQPFSERGRVQVTLDGSGTVHAVQTVTTLTGPKGVDPEYHLDYAVRQAGGTFSAPTRFPFDLDSVDIAAQEDGRVLAAWWARSQVEYAIRQPGGSFGPAQTVSEGAGGSSVRLAVAPRGPAALAWLEPIGTTRRRVAMARIASDGSVATPSYRGFPAAGSEAGTLFPSVAINEAGLVIAAWEQQCSYPNGGIAVTAVAFDHGGRSKEPPCQDRRAPKVIAVWKRAKLNGRTLRVRVACDETCRLTVSARVLASGQRKPLATAKTRSERRLAARRGGWVRLALSDAERRRIERAHRRGSKVTARLAVSVRDAYGNGRRWRIAVPVRR